MRVACGCIGAAISAITCLLAVALILVGRARMNEARESSQLTVMTLDDFLAAKPRNGYYRVTGCILHVGAGVASWMPFGNEKTRRMAYAYVPVHKANEGRRSPAHVVLMTDDPAIHETLREIYSHNGEPLAEARKWFKENASRATVARDVQGRVGTKSDWMVSPEYTSQIQNLTADHILLKESKPPSLRSNRIVRDIGIGILVVQPLLWLLIGAAFILIGRRQNRSAT